MPAPLLTICKAYFIDSRNICNSSSEIQLYELVETRLLAVPQPERIADCRALQTVECLRQLFGWVGPALLQPPLHQRDLRPCQIVRQHIERDGAASFGKGGAQTGFELLGASGADSAQEQRAFLALKYGVQHRPRLRKMPVGQYHPGRRFRRQQFVGGKGMEGMEPADNGFVAAHE